MLLVIDLSSSLYLALVDEAGRLLAARVSPQGTRGEAAHGLLDECLAEAGAAPGDLARVCAGTGPGSFTGIRVGVALAQGLAFARRLPIHPFSSLAGMIAGVDAATPEASRASVIAANGGRYYASAGGREALLSLGEVEALAGTFPLLITSGNIPDVLRFAAAFAEVRRFEDSVGFPLLARHALAQSPVLDGVVRPNYLMASAAEEKRRT